MNNQKLLTLLEGYKQHFNSIHSEEIYKWRAVKCFQDNWNIGAPDFHTMLARSLAQGRNLLDSGQYFPKRMMLQYAEVEAETVRSLFIDLYNEEEDMIARIISFQEGIRAVHNRHFSEKKDYQDKRAVLVYLSLRFPDRYYLYKYTMFKDFAAIVNYPYQPRPGGIQNILEYLSLCDIVRAEIVKDTDLLELHRTRIAAQEYLDSSFHILTQDVIYAAVRHIDKFEIQQRQDPALSRLRKVEKRVSSSIDHVVLRGSFTNHIENEREKKRIGDLGELLVLQHEQEKLQELGFNRTPEHKSKSEGDGLGYDILSFDGEGNEMYIEVKTTTGAAMTPFYITRNELERSKQARSRFFLYRLFEFDDLTNTANFFERHGDLEELCINPILFKAVVSD